MTDHAKFVKNIIDNTYFSCYWSVALIFGCKPEVPILGMKQDQEFRTSFGVKNVYQNLLLRGFKQ